MSTTKKGTLDSSSNCNHYPKYVAPNQYVCWFCGIPLECAPKSFVSTKNQVKDMWDSTMTTVCGTSNPKDSYRVHN